MCASTRSEAMTVLPLNWVPPQRPRDDWFLLWDDAQHMPYCELCWKWADDKHLASRAHRRNVADPVRLDFCWRHLCIRIAEMEFQRAAAVGEPIADSATEPTATPQDAAPATEQAASSEKAAPPTQQQSPPPEAAPTANQPVPTYCLETWTGYRVFADGTTEWLF